MTEGNQFQKPDDIPEWSEDDVIRFPLGIPGFEDIKRYIVISVPEYEPFHWLQAVDGSKIRLAVINPMIIKSDYSPQISKSELKSLGIVDPKDLLVYVIITLRSPLNESTANFMGPLFINIQKKIGKQIIIEDAKYSLREQIIE